MEPVFAMQFSVLQCLFNQPMFRDVFDEVCTFHKEQQGSVHWISMGDFQSAITKFPKQVRNPLENLLDGSFSDRWKYPVTSTQHCDYLLFTYKFNRWQNAKVATYVEKLEAGKQPNNWKELNTCISAIAVQCKSCWISKQAFPNNES